MKARIVCTLVCLLAACSAFAQSAPWTGTVRGSWVQTGAAAEGDVVLSSTNGVCRIVVAANENPAVHQAAAFLAGDIEKISGYKPEVAPVPGSGGVNVRLVTLGRSAVPATINTASLAGQWESYRVVVEGRDVWLIGSNPRGTAFAAYTLSERLGVDPIYIWSGYWPEHHDPLILKRVNFYQAPPAFRYRGFFHDDEDLLPRPFDARGYPLMTGDVPLEWYKRFFETALRLRMNMGAPYVRVHRRYEVQKLASDWGLYYDWFTNRDGMLRFWRGGLMENKDLDVIWPVGMRGTADRPFTFPPGTTDDQKAATFREVIREQVKMVREVVPQPLFHFTMYSEMLPQYQRDPAAFDLPEDVMIIWPDDNNGHMRGLPGSLGKWKHGVYYHLAYLGGNLSKQTTHTETPSVVADEFQKIVQAGATEYMLVNVSELRDYVMGARLIADICWDARAVYAAPRAAERYTAWWSREYFGGPDTARAAEAAYHRYFSLLDSPDTLWTAMEAIQTLVDGLYRKVAGHSPAAFDPGALARLQSRAELLDEALAAVEQAGHGMTPAQRRFFSIDVALGLQIAQRQTRAALKLEEALRAPDAGRMWQLVREALSWLEQLEADLARGEYAPFDRWYQESWIRSAGSLNNPHRAYRQVRDFIGSDGRDQRPPATEPGLPPVAR
jgi:hypothetical protein